MTEPHDLFALYNDAFGAAPVGLDVPRSVEVAHPVAVVSYLTDAGPGHLPPLSRPGRRELAAAR